MGGAASHGGYRLAAIDLDGTLLRSDGTVSERTRKSVRRASESGILPLIVSARPPRIVRRYWEELELDGLALCCNGAIVYDPQRHTVVESFELDALTIVGNLRRSIPEVTLGWECGLAYGCDGGFLLKHHFEGGSEDLETVECEANKVLVHHPTLPQSELHRRTLEVLGATATVTISGHDVVEVMAPGVSKAAGVANLAKALEADLSAVVAFGDMPNDMPLLRLAGLGVAMANADAAVREIADEVTASNDEDGVALVLERLTQSASRESRHGAIPA